MILACAGTRAHAEAERAQAEADGNNASNVASKEDTKEDGNSTAGDGTFITPYSSYSYSDIPKPKRRFLSNLRNSISIQCMLSATVSPVTVMTRMGTSVMNRVGVILMKNVMRFIMGLNLSNMSTRRLAVGITSKRCSFGLNSEFVQLVNFTLLACQQCNLTLFYRLLSLICEDPSCSAIINLFNVN